MHHRFRTTVGLALLLLTSACGGGGAESLMDVGKSTMEELTTTLESIQDEESAIAAVPKLEALGARMKSLKEQTEALSEEEQKELKGMEDDAETRELLGKMMKEMMRVQMDDQLAPHLKEAFESFQ